MRVEAGVRLGDHLAIKEMFAAAGFVAATNDDSGSVRIEGEQETPYAVCCVKSQFLHLGVTGTFQSIDMGPA